MQILKSLGNLEIDLGKYDSASYWLNEFNKEVILTGSLSQNLDPVWQLLALLASKRADFSEAESYYHKLLKLRKAALPADDAECLSVQVQMALLQEKNDNYKKAESEWSDIAVKTAKLLDSQKVLYEVLSATVNLYERFNMFDEVDILFRRLLNLSLKNKNADQKFFCASLATMDRFYEKQGNQKKNADLKKYLLERSDRGSKFQLYLLMSMAKAKQDAGRYTEAISLYDQILSAVPVNDHSLKIQILTALFQAYRLHGDMKALISAAKNLNPDLKKLTRKDSIFLAQEIERAGESCVATGSIGNAVTLLEKARGIFIGSKWTDSAAYATNLHYLAYCYGINHKFTEAKQCARESCRLKEKLGLDDGSYTLTLEVLAGVYLTEKKYGEAEAIYREALKREEKIPRDKGRSKSILLYYIGVCSAAQNHYAEAKNSLLAAEKLGSEVGIESNILNLINTVLDQVMSASK
ncbi:MAG: tetratricopeptide repeat protein [Candidatus Obscuribacterales bacterium]|nr:tetratricopeptide repeat protein [Candidatus Obscuribacterales bacterium]